jgi:hypothetical protein
LRATRGWLVVASVVGGIVALGACGGGDSSGSATGDDSGVTVDTGGGADVSTGHDGSSSGGFPDASGSSSGGNDGSASGSSSGGGDGGNGDAAYAFDGFAHPDGYSEASYCPDDDGDGFTVCAGDCNDHDSLINPCAFDTNDPTDPVGMDGLDNDCDGHVDNLITCESGLTAGHDPTASHYANAADLCDNPMCPRIVNAIWYGPSPANARRITGHMGNMNFAPHQGQLMAFLSSGQADDNTDTPAYKTCLGTDYNSTFTHPSPLTAAQNTNPCGQGKDESMVTVHDYTELRMAIKAPVNAGSFTFDFAFFSEEYPVYVCQGFNDTFLAMQISKQYPSSMYPNGYEIAYDSNGHRVNVNNSFFQDCNSAQMTWGYGYTHTCANPITLLNGTGYEVPINTSGLTTCNGNHGSGGTDWLKTTSPIQPGEQFQLSWIIFDEADGILDSSVVLDHFRWHSTTLGSPVTGR